MNKKSGQAGSIVAPIAPIDPHEADKANPGEVEDVKAEQRQTQTGKYGSVKAKPFKPATPSALSDSYQTESGEQTRASDEQQVEKKLSWLEIELIGEDDKPTPGEPYRITLPDGSVAEGTLDHQGFARVEGFEKGDCKITFPNLDQAAWEDV